MNHLRRLGNRISIPIQPDEDGFTGRECPNPDCEGYFKIEFGTGLKGENIPCHCPYCGRTASHDQFWTKEQIEYVRSVAVRTVTDALRKDLKKLEFDYKPRGLLGIGLSVKVKPGPLPPFTTTERKGSKRKSFAAIARCATRSMGFSPSVQTAGFTTHFRSLPRTWSWLPRCLTWPRLPSRICRQGLSRTHWKTACLASTGSGGRSAIFMLGKRRTQPRQRRYRSRTSKVQVAT
jgi:hypothetical protein